MKIRNEKENQTIDINNYFVEQYVNSFKHLEIVPVDYIEMKQIYENESGIHENWRDKASRSLRNFF